MQRTTQLMAALRAYTGGGSRAVLGDADDTKPMQEVAASFMKGEARKGIEAAQNYGFTSVHFGQEKDSAGKVLGAAESFVSFNGANRSFPSMGATDDRRHRMMGLPAGDTAMFRGRGDMQQFHMSGDGGFWSAPQDKTVRMQLLTANSASNNSVQQGGAGGSAGAHVVPGVVTALVGRSASGSGDSGSSGGGGTQAQHGQKAVYKDGQKNHQCVEVTKDKTRAAGTTVHLGLADGNTYLHVHSDKNVYVGGESGKGSFAKLVTVNGPCTNSQGKIG